MGGAVFIDMGNDTVVALRPDPDIQAWFARISRVFHRDAETGKCFRQRQDRCAVDITVEKIAEVCTTDGFQRLFGICICHSSRQPLVERLAETLPKQPHHIIQRLMVAGGFTDGQVQQQGNQRAFGIVTDQGIR